MSSSEFVEWMAFYQLEPFGPRRDNMHSGQIASLLYNQSRKRSAPPLGTEDFMYKDVDVKQAEQEAEFLSGLRRLAQAQKAKKNG